MFILTYRPHNVCDSTPVILYSKWRLHQHMKTIKTTIPSPVFKYSFPYNICDIAFFDIETTGLSPKVSSLYLIGMMYYDESARSWTLIQWFADNYKSEAEIINSFFSLLSKYKYLYHFNGRTFDIPYVKNKCDKHKITIPSDIESIFDNSIDILASIRPLKKLLSLSKANQTALEHWLGIMRDDKYDGGQLISVYSEYMQKKIMAPEKSSELEKILLLHNHDDIAQMLNVCSIMSYYDFLNSKTDIEILSAIIDENAMLQIKFTSQYIFPKKVTLCKALPDSKSGLLSELCANLTFDSKQVTLSIPVLEGTLLYFIDNYKDYYYMESKDIAIHKSILSKEDKPLCKKAAASNCYTKKEGIFIPSITLRKINDKAHTFYLVHKDKLCFYLLPEMPFDTKDKFFAEYTALQISAFI